MRLPYSDFAKPGVRFVRETIIAIDPDARRVEHQRGSPRGGRARHRARRRLRLRRDPGLLDGGNEFYSVAGAERMRDVLPTFTSGRAVVGVCGAPFKCPPAPSEAALLLHDYLSTRGVRDGLRDLFVMPFGTPCRRRPRPLRRCSEAFAERGIEFVPGTPRQPRLIPAAGSWCSTMAREVPYDLFLGVPKHRAPDVVLEAGMAEDGYIPWTRRTLETPLPGRLCRGGRGDRGRAEGRGLLRGCRAGRRRGHGAHGARRASGPTAYDGRGSCYIEFGGGRVGRVDVDFLSGPRPTGDLPGSRRATLVAEKEDFGSSRRARWFGG